MTPLALQRNIAHAQAKAALVKRYLPECRNQTRVLFSQGKLNLARHHHEGYARALAELRAADAIRHGVTEDLLNNSYAIAAE